jgi:dienelactone hydrolase
MTDVLGMDFPNIQLIADQFAQNGYLTVIPDVFNGSEVPFLVLESFNLQEYIETTMPKTDTVDPMFEKVIKHLKEDLGVKRLGGVGYCFGGKYVCRFLKEGGLSNGGIDAGFTAHPSFVDADEVRNIKGPLSIAAAGMKEEDLHLLYCQNKKEVLTIKPETDAIFPAEKRRQTEDILKDHTVPYQMFLYSDVEHGFGVKGDLSHAKARFAKEQAFLQAVYWFEEYVKKAPGV